MYRLISILFVIYIFLGSGYSQDKSLPPYISIDLKNIALEQALNAVSEKYSVRFFYSSSKIPLKTIINLKIDSISVASFLDQLCNQAGISYRINENQVILIPSANAKWSAFCTVSGFITDSLSGERLIGANLVITDLQEGTVSNAYGFYSYTVPKGKHTLRFTYLGYTSYEKTLTLESDTKISIPLVPQFFLLKEVKMKSLKNNKALSLKLGADYVSMDLLREYPALFGESDVVQFIKMLPGVQTTTDGISGLYIRGSTPQQNSFLVDDAPMFNMYHISGWFSTVNPDAVKDVQLYKSHLPSHTGGSLSSIVDIRLRDGNNQKFVVTGGIGTITSRLTIEGPILRNKSSFIISARRSYIDKLIKALRLENDINVGETYFYDLNSKINYTLNHRNRFFISFYFGKDIISENNGTDWGNLLLSTRWNHLFSERLFSNFTITASKYKHQFYGTDGDNSQYRFFTSLKNYSLKYDFTWYKRSNHKLYFGANANYMLMPFVQIEGLNNASQSFYDQSTYSQIIYNLYTQSEFDITKRWMFEAGIRISSLQQLQPQNNNLLINPEPTVTTRYEITGKSSVKAGYSRNLQYYHGANVFGLLIPFERYLFVNSNLKPQYADHFSAGYFFTNSNKNIEISVEPYFSKMKNQYRFTIGNEIILGKNMEKITYKGKSNAYGVEFSARKLSGKFTGLVSYTWAKIDKQENGINSGDYFNPYYDRRHDLVINSCLNLTKKMSFSATWVYMSGNPYSLPVGKYELRDRTVPLYDNNNLYNHRMPDYHRLDLSVKFSFGRGRHYQHSLSLMVFNVYNRKNSILYSYRDIADNDYTKDANNNYTYRNFSMLGYYFFNILPAFSYEFKFE